VHFLSFILLRSFILRSGHIHQLGKIYPSSNERGKTMRKKTAKAKPQIELHFEHVKNKITEWEKDLKAGSQTGPWIMLLIGALVTTVGFFNGIFRDRFTIGIIVGIIGILIIIAAWIWSKRRSKYDKNVEDTILKLKGDLSSLEKER